MGAGQRQGAIQRWREIVMGACVAASLFAALPDALVAADTTPATASGGAADEAVMRRATELMAHRLVNAALARARDTTVPTQRIAQEAAILLQESLRLEPDNLHTLKLLLEAARNSGTPESAALQKDTLRKIIRLDAGDMVAQVAYLDLVASASQVLEERARVYQAALKADKLDPQIRSQMAVRLARLALERGDTQEAKSLFTQALTFNDVNVEALRELALLGDRSGPGRLKNLIALLNVNPYQPTVWIETSNVLGAAGVHDRAADCLVVALEQTHISGIPPAGELYLQLAMEYAAAGRNAEAYPILNSLAQLEDAPLSALMAAELLSHEYSLPMRPEGSGGEGGWGQQPATQETPAMRRAQPTPGDATRPVAPRDPTPAPGGPATTPAEPLADRIVKRLNRQIEAQPKQAGPLAEAVWVQFSGLQQVTPQAASWLKTYTGMVPADDQTLARLTGWQLLREKKPAEAQATLEKLAAADPLAQLGLARALIEQNKIPEATKQLQDLWSSHPTGLLAFQVAQTARLAKIPLNNTVMTQQMLEVFGTLPRRTMVAHRDPKEQQLAMVSLPKRVYELGEPVMLDVRLTNTSDNAAPVGIDGVIKTTLGLTAASRGMNAQSLGMYAVEELQRVYRLERRGSIETTVRADSGPLGDMLSLQPAQTLIISMGALLAPRGNTRAPSLGLGGQTLGVGEFERSGIPLKMDVLTNLMQNVGNLPLDRQLLRAEQVSTIFLAIPKEPETPPRNPQETADREGMRMLRGSVVNVLQDCVKSPSPLMRAWMLQNIPPSGVNEVIQGAVDAMASDPDRLVRMLWSIRQMVVARTLAKDPPARERALSQLEKQRDAEKDAVAKMWVTMLIEDERNAAAATQAGNATSQPGK